MLMQGEEDNFNEEMILITRDFKRFLRKKVGDISSRR